MDLYIFKAFLNCNVNERLQDFLFFFIGYNFIKLDIMNTYSND